MHTQGGRLFHAQQAQPIRIVFSYEDLTEPGAFCASTAGTAPSYLTEGETVSCNDPTHVLNSTKIALLQNIDFVSWWGPAYAFFLADPAAWAGGALFACPAGTEALSLFGSIAAAHECAPKRPPAMSLRSTKARVI